MKNRKKYAEVFIIGMLILLVGAINLVSAEEIESIPENISFNFMSWFQHTFGIQDFSIAGQERHCDIYPEKTLYFTTNGQNVMMDIDVADYCSSGRGLIDLFTNNWNPFKEYKDSVTRYCGFAYDQCIAEIYCCDHDECSRDSQCEDWEGPGSECEISYEDDPIIDYDFSSYKYCTSGCTGSDITCWREEGGVCVSRTYDCSYGTYPSCPTTYKYTSKSQCEDSPPTNGNGEVPTDCNVYQTRNQCNDDSDCEWEEGTWLVHGKCIEKVGNGNGDSVRGNQKGINKDDIIKLTYSNLKDSICVETEDCKEGVCLPQDYLINRGYLSESKAESTLGNYCDEGAISTYLEILGGYIGLTEGVCGWIFDDYDQWITSYGYCIADYEDEESGITQFLKSIGRAIPITGEPLTDGIIVLGGGILLLVLVMSRLYYGEIKYEISNE